MKKPEDMSHEELIELRKKIKRFKNVMQDVSHRIAVIIAENRETRNQTYTDLEKDIHRICDIFSRKLRDRQSR